MTNGCMSKLTAPQFAFRTQHQGHEVVYILRSLIEKAIEWGSPLFVLDGDLRKAYDYTQHKSVIKGLSAKHE